MRDEMNWFDWWFSSEVCVCCVLSLVSWLRVYICTPTPYCQCWFSCAKTEQAVYHIILRIEIADIATSNLAQHVGLACLFQIGQIIVPIWQKCTKVLTIERHIIIADSQNFQISSWDHHLPIIPSVSVDWTKEYLKWVDCCAPWAF